MLRKLVFILGLFIATAACAACPDGYTSATGGDSIDDCYMEIAPGYYWTGSATEICPKGFACAGGNMPYAARESEWGIIDCDHHSVYFGGTSCTQCPIETLDGIKGGVGAGGCLRTYVSTASGFDLGLNPYTTATANCYWNGTHYGVGGNNPYGCDAYNITACAAGYYAPTVSNFTIINCIPVEAGYYSPEGSTERTACPDGLTTAGYGPAADEAADCGHALHIGDQTLYLRSEKRTTPALHVKVGGATFYGDMSTESKGHLRVKIGDTVYSVFDDSM